MHADAGAHAPFSSVTSYLNERSCENPQGQTMANAHCLLAAVVRALTGLTIANAHCVGAGAYFHHRQAAQDGHGQDPAPAHGGALHGQGRRRRAARPDGCCGRAGPRQAAAPL